MKYLYSKRKKKVDTVMDKLRLFNCGQENNSNIIIVIIIC